MQNLYRIYVLNFLKFWFSFQSTCTNMMRQASQRENIHIACLCIMLSSVPSLPQAPSLDAKIQRSLDVLITYRCTSSQTFIKALSLSSRELCQDGPGSQWYNAATLSLGTFPNLNLKSKHTSLVIRALSNTQAAGHFICLHLESELVDRDWFCKEWAKKLTGFKAHSKWKG